MAFDWAIGTMRCPHCDYRLYEDQRVNEEIASPSANAPQTDLTGKPPIKFEAPPGLDMDDLPDHLSDYEQVRLRSRLHTAMWALARGNQNEINKSLHAVLDISEDHADTWLHLAAMANDAAEQRHCLEHVIAARPGHPLAMRLMAELDGELDPDPDPASRGKLAPDQIAAKQIVCPICSGTLTYNAASKEVTCKYCGHRIVDADDLARTNTHSTVLAGNMKRKQQARAWNVGKKWLRCDNCGAITTISRATLTHACRFCHSQQIVVESVDMRFEQPDLIVPFGLDARQAHAAVETYLKTGIRWFTRFFADAIARIELQSSYLPFWIFDADMVVNWSWTRDPAHGQHPILLSDIPFFAARTPAARLLQKIEPFDLRRGVDYDPRLVAAHPAELYDIDLPDASIQVRQRLTRDACRKAEPSLRLRKPSGYGSDDDAGSLRLNAYTQFLTYRLGLLPVWIGQLIEEDGDTRQIVVNGQTGKVSQGKLQKAQR